jgi:DNA-binding CsgD family transcriptional regulator/tetratricopeptide (TPR) repeat protein
LSFPVDHRTGRIGAGRDERIVETSTIFCLTPGAGTVSELRFVAMGVLLDRDVELGELSRRIATARSGSGRVIVVEGPAGIGKSTLLAAVGRAARADGMTVLSARCSPLEQPAAWGTARQLFEPLRIRPEWAELTTGAAGLAERALAPEGGGPAPVGDAMHAAARGLVWLVSNLGERGPAVLVVDDVHWADAPSLRWLAVLARSLEGLRIGVLCAVRAGEPVAAPDLLAELLAGAPEPPVRPRALGPVATETLVRQRLPAASAGFTHACHAVTGGNPFLLGALLTQLLAEGVVPDDDTAARLGTFGSEQVARVIERQLARLPDGAGLARAVAVLGPGAPLRHAAALAGLELYEAARAADALRAAGVLADTPVLELAHPLITGTLYTRMPAGARGRHHAEAAALLARERAEPERVALHLLRTEPAGEPATVATLRDAARRATARGAPQTAATYLRRALAEQPATAGEEADVQLELALVLAAFMHADAFELLHKAVGTADTPTQRGTIALAGARACGLGGHFDTAIALSRSGLSAGAAIPPELHARLEAELIADAWLHEATMSEARERLRRVAASPPRVELWRVNAALEAVCDARPAREALEILVSALHAGALVDDPDSVLGTLAKIVLIACGELDAAREHCAELIDLARPRGWLIALAHGCFMRAMALVQAGEIRDAEADGRLALEIKLTHSPPVALIWGVFPLVDALTELGEFADAEAVLAGAGYLGDPPPGALASPLLLESRAHLRLAQHRHGDARGDLFAAGERWSSLGIRHPGLAAWRVHLSEALVAQGDLGGARELAEEHLALAERVGLPGPHGAGLRAVARTAGREEAVILLEQAVNLLAKSPAQLEHVRALVDLGIALRRTNRRAAARTPLRRALHLSERGGMRLLADRARHELHAVGARPRRPALSGIDSLTPAEHRVAMLAAQGHSNPRIAQQLYVTRRTVETHLTHVFQKLDLSTRADLTTRLATSEPADRRTRATKEDLVGTSIARNA